MSRPAMTAEAREEKKRQKMLEEQLNRDLVDAIRACRGLGPLYPRPMRSHYKCYQVWSSGRLGDGCRQVLRQSNPW